MELQNLLQRLDELSGLKWLRWFKSEPRSEQLSILREIADTQDLRFIPGVMAYLDSGYGLALASCLGDLTERCSPRDWLVVDEDIRREWYSYGVYRGGFTIQALERLNLDGSLAVRMYGLASMVPNGRDREKALERLGRVDTGAELPFLLIRANDWVAEIRGHAYRMLNERLRPDYAAHFVRYLPLAQRLDGCGRGNHRLFLEALTGLLSQDESRRVLYESFAGFGRSEARWVFRLLIDGGFPDRMGLIRCALSSYDDVVRLYAARLITDVCSRAEFDEWFDVLRTDSYFPVRRECLRAMIRLDHEVLNDELERGLLDFHHGIRAFCRYYLKERGWTSFGSFYAKAVEQDDEMLIPALGGLAECREPAYLDLMSTHLSHARSRVRRWAALGYSWTASEGQHDALLPLLRDESGVVRKMVRRFFAKHPASISAETLWGFYEIEEDASIRIDLLRCIAGRSRWEALPYLIRVMACVACRDDHDVYRVYHRFVSSWNSSGIQPSENDLRRVSSVLSEFEAELPAEFVNEWRNLLKVWCPPGSVRG